LRDDAGPALGEEAVNDVTEPNEVHPRSPDMTWRHGAREALPIVFGYVPIGIAYGVLGTAAGLPGWAVIAMSVVVYAGSAQFIAVSLLASGATAVAIVATTFLVNLRHILYASALSPRLQRMSRGRLAWLAAELTDESFVMISRVIGSRRTSIDPTGAEAGAGGMLPFGLVAGLQGTAQLSWVAGSALGVAAGSFIGEPARYGLDYALVAMFLGLLALQIHGRREVAVAFTAGLVALGLRLLGMGTSGVIPATLIASAVGLLFVPPPGRAGDDLPAAATSSPGSAGGPR